MTVTTLTNTISHVSDGVQESFVYDFRALDASHLQVFLDDVLESPSNYTVTGVNNPTGGTIDYPPGSPPAPGTLRIDRIVPIDQEVDYRVGDPFPAETHELALDKLTMINQQVDEQVSRGIIGVPGESGYSYAFTQPYANTLLAFNAAGDRVINIEPAEDRAYRWAETDEDVVVESRGGRDRYSAFHWASKAETIVGLPFQNVGDLLTGTAPGGLGNVTILPVGLIDGMILTVNPVQPQGLEWRLPAGTLPPVSLADVFKVPAVNVTGDGYELTELFGEQVFPGALTLGDDGSEGNESVFQVPHHAAVAARFINPVSGQEPRGWLNGIILRRHDSKDYKVRLILSVAIGATGGDNVQFTVTPYIYSGLNDVDPAPGTPVTVVALVPSLDSASITVEFEDVFLKNPGSSEFDVFASLMIQRDFTNNVLAEDVDLVAARVMVQ